MLMNNKLPITRLGKFFGQDDFDLQLRMGQEYLQGDLNMKLVLYRVDRQKTDTDDVYLETSGSDKIVFFPPVEFSGLIKIDPPKNETYKEGMIRYLEPGNITVSVYIKQLEELKIDIRYGDYLGYPESETKMRYYTVVNDGKVVSDNKHNMFGYKPYYRTITGSFVQDVAFRGV
jgi:hypothetical protein